MIHAQKIADEKWALESSFDTSDELNQKVLDINLAEPNSNLHNAIGQDIEEFDIQDESSDVSVDRNKKSGMFSGWFGQTKEQKKAQIEFEKFQKKFSERSVDGNVISLPPQYLPSAWACLALFATLTLHALFHLLCHWIVKFKAMVYYTSVSEKKNNTSGVVLDENCFILVVPPSNRGKSALIKLKRTSSNMLQLEFQRQTYVYTPPNKLNLANSSNSKYKSGVFTLLTSPTNLPCSTYTAAAGLTSEAEIEKTLERWGKNHLSVAQPSFLELLQLQLLSPLAMFQVFCSLLWLLDEYWTYTLWTLCSVVIFEGTTVFQRSRTMAMLGGMSPKPTPLYIYRCGSWKILSTKDILPGDLISLSYQRAAAQRPEDPASASASPAAASDAPAAPATSRSEVVPCDCLILAGAAVANEASLTGESVPQMKEALCDASAQALDMTGAHRVHVLFSGTSLVTIRCSAFPLSAAPPPPDKGIIAYALRTGFSSSQGSLLQMIEFSQQTVSGDAKETGWALLLLFCFALVAAAYVLKEGLRKKEKTTHELLLKCVIIITSVVPRQFPMQMAMAVNMALMSLTKAGIFCTEQYRVPMAGKVTHVLFDKTGTLTTDQLVPSGVVAQATEQSPLKPISSSEGPLSMVLAACHSLVSVDSSDASGTAAATLAGDPIELAAMKAVEWRWDAATNTALPGCWQVAEKALGLALTKQKELLAMTDQQKTAVKPSFASVTGQLAKDMTHLEQTIATSKARAASSMYQSVQVAARQHFSSQLQRMSTVCLCSPSTSGNRDGDWFCLVKGSPEALLPLMLPKQVPVWYQAAYDELSRKGLRILCLAYKQLPNPTATLHPTNLSREVLESHLHFAGFVAFECKIRGDSAAVVGALRQSDHRVAMLTGDAILTSLHVARKVGIASQAVGATLKAAASAPGSAHWIVRHADGTETILPFDVDQIPQLSAQQDLLTTEADFMAVTEATGGEASKLWQHVGEFKVFARMSPSGKAAMIRAIQQKDQSCVLMCGDGGNDVGALKQADVGLALLGGHANANTSEEVVKGDELEITQVSAEDALNAREKSLEKRGKEVNELRAAHMKEFQARVSKEQQAVMQEEIRKLTEKGDYMAMFGLVKQQTSRVKKLMDDENRRFMALHGRIYDPKKDGDGADGAAQGGLMAQLMSQMEDSDAAAPGLAVIRPGDASVAAPFTSRIPSVRAVVDLIRQGRCTLLSALMQQQIMMLESIIAAYTLSCLSLHNARSSERQMMASSWLIMTAAVSFSYASPLDHMHPERPLRSLFHPAIILSILGQAAIHIACMALAVKWATETMGPEALKEVTEFFRKAKAKEIDLSAACGEEDYVCQLNAFWAAPFMPNLLNSVVFLVETSQMISVFFTNYKGRPWMKGMMENHPLFLSVFICVAGVVVAAWEMVPQLNDLIQLAPFPATDFRYKVVGLVLSSIVGTFVWDRICTYFFAPRIYTAMWKEFEKTRLSDLTPIVMTLLKIVVVVALLGTGNLLLLAGAVYWYRNQKPAAK